MVNIVVINVSLIKGMAGTNRVKNLLTPLQKKGLIQINNLAIATSYEKDLIGNQGVESGISYLYIGIANIRNLISIFRFVKSGKLFLKKKYSNQDKNILYCYGLPDLLNFKFLRYAQKIGYKIIFDIIEDNNLAKNEQFLSWKGWLRNKSSLYFQNKLQLLGDGVIVISDYLQNVIKNNVTDTFPVIKVPVSFNPDNFLDGIEKSELHKKPIRIFYGGSFAPKDGIALMLKAFASVLLKVDNVELVLTGTGKADDLQIMEYYQSNYPQIKWLGYLDDALYFKMLKESDICCVTRVNSKYANAGFPFKLAEFLAAGKIIISTNIGEIPNYLKDGHNAIIIQPDSVEALEDALLFTINNFENIKNKLGENALKTANIFFNSENISLDLFAFINII